MNKSRDHIMKAKLFRILYSKRKQDLRTLPAVFILKTHVGRTYKSRIGGASNILTCSTLTENRTRFIVIILHIKIALQQFKLKRVACFFS